MPACCLVDVLGVMAMPVPVALDWDPDCSFDDTLRPDHQPHEAVAADFLGVLSLTQGKHVAVLSDAGQMTLLKDSVSAPIPRTRRSADPRSVLGIVDLGVLEQGGCEGCFR